MLLMRFRIHDREALQRLRHHNVLAMHEGQCEVLRSTKPLLRAYIGYRFARIVLASASITAAFEKIDLAL